MSDNTEVKGSFTFDQDSKRFHRFKIKGDNGIVGNMYVPKGSKGVPEKVTLTFKEKE